MEGTYGVYLGKDLCGKLQVLRQGLYYQFICRCQFPEGTVYRLRVHFPEKEENLGILTPLGDGFGLNKKIPAKHFTDKPLRFCLVPIHSSMEGHFAPILPEEPFHYIERLKDAYLVKKYGQIGILIK